MPPDFEDQPVPHPYRILTIVLLSIFAAALLFAGLFLRRTQSEKQTDLNFDWGVLSTGSEKRDERPVQLVTGPDREKFYRENKGSPRNTILSEEKLRVLIKSNTGSPANTILSEEQLRRYLR